MSPENNIGKIAKALEKYFNPTKGEMDVKSRPVLVIGCEDNYTSPHHVDYELLPISKLNNTTPDEDYDYLIDGKKQEKLGLHAPSYIRSNKTTWTHSKQMRLKGMGNLKETYPESFNAILTANHKWVENRNFSHAATESDLSDEAASDQKDR
ncbi:hypothetical protein [Halobacillus seohaensis]|uniref:Uncharacterized protein n=1 Tax=Halobacillus seohaensis TaxID=447421 RepID=A0ABW2EN14_9BACI